MINVYKKGDSNALWLIIAIVLGLIVITIYSYMTNGIVRRVLNSTGTILDNQEDELYCRVMPGTFGDDDFDGVRDEGKCARFVDS